MRRKLGTFCMYLGTVLLIAALSLLTYFRWVEHRAEKASQAVLGQLEVLDMVDVEIAIEGGQTGWTSLEEGDMPSIQLEGWDCIGTVSIPRFELSLPILSEWSYGGLEVAPARYSGSVWNDDLIILGHNYRSHFAPLKDLEVGDEVVFTDLLKLETRFRVTELRVLEPTAVEELQGGDWDLTLFTCTRGGKARVVVRCERVK